jgi:hypothetical protein
MEETLKPGGSTKELWLSRQSSTTNPLTSKAQEEQETCKFGAPTPNGSRSSNTSMDNSSTSKIQELLPY